MSSKGISQPDRPERPHGPGEENRTIADDSKTLPDSATGPSPVSEARPAVQVPDHELLKRIGQGSYGEVWLARNVMGTYRAVKIVYRAAFEHARPFEREFNGIQKFEPISRSHDGFVDVLQIGRAPEYFYYVMELADDVVTGQQIDPATYQPKTLRSQVQGRKALPFEQCVELGLSLTAALSHLHGHGLIHRDIKPSNIIFVNGIPKLADIGLVAEQSEAKSFVGTEGFIPPEGPGTAQADIYSLGKVLYEIATGKDRHEFPALPTLLGDSATDTQLLELNSVVLRACQAETRSRYLCAQQMRDDLLLLSSGKSVKRAHRNERQLSLLYQISAAGFLLTILTVLGMSYLSKEAAKARQQAAREARLRSEAEAREEESRQNLYAAQMLLAAETLAESNFGEVRELLNSQRPAPFSKGSGKDLRGWEWRYFWNQVRADELFTLGRQKVGITTVSFRPDGRELASGSWDPTVVIWNVAERRGIAQLKHPQMARAVAYSSDGVWLATGCADGVVRLWDAQSHTLKHAITNELEVQSLVFSPDSSLLAGDSVQWVKLWKVATQEPLISFPGNNFHLFTGMAFSPNNALFAYPTTNGELRIWNLKDSSLAVSLTGAVESVQTLKFTPDGKQLLAGGQNRLVEIWDVEHASVRASLTNFASWIGQSDISPDGKQAAIACSDQTVHLFDTATWRPIRLLKGHADEVFTVAYGPDGNSLASGSKDRTIKIWKPVPEAELPTFSPFAPDLVFCTLSPAGEALLMIYSDSTYQVCDTATARRSDRQRLPARLEKIMWSRIDAAGRLRGIAVSPLGQLIAFGGEHGRVVLWSRAEGRPVVELSDNADLIQMLAFSYESTKLAIAKANRELEIWSVPEARRLRTIVSAEAAFQCLTFSPSSKMVAASYVKGEPEIWRLSDGVRLCQIRGHESEVNAIALSADDRLAATVSWDAKVKVWDLGSQKELVSVGGALAGFIDVAISPDGTRVAGLSGEGKIKLIDVQKKLVVGSLKGSGQLAFLPDGNTLIAVDLQGLRVWRAAKWSETDRPNHNSQDAMRAE